MTNFEKYKDELAKLGVEYGKIAVVGGKPVRCNSSVRCNDCAFVDCENAAECINAVRIWAKSKYKEPAKLNEQEKMFCEMVGTGWLSRDMDGTLIVSAIKPPYKMSACWAMANGNYITSTSFLFSRWLKDSFQFIKWEDEEPWSIADILERCKVE